MVVYRHTHNIGRILIGNLPAGLGLVLVATFLLAMIMIMIMMAMIMIIMSGYID